MKTTVYLSAFAFAAAFSFVGCGDPLLDDLDSNIEVGSGDLSIAEDYEQAAGMFLTAQQKMHDVGASNGAHVYQVQFNIHIDNYAGYMAGTQNFDGKLPSTYRYFAEYCDGPQASFFNVAHAALPVMRSAADLNLREIGAMCNIMYCFSALELSDVYGPFPWTDYKNDVQEPPVTYEPMDQIYDSLFVNLKDAGKILKEFTSTSEEHQDTINQILAQYDKICGDVKTWEQFSNSIRLRMAMRMSNVNPDRAKTEAQSAIDDGLIEKSIEYNTMVNNGTNHPLAFISILWNDTRMNASLENIMKRLKVPFMDKIFEKNSADIRDITGEITCPAGQEIVGVRTGIALTARDDNNPYLKYSGVTSAFANFPLAIFKLSERYFLQAEAALRWNIGGSVNTNYLRGVAAMFSDYSIAQTDPEFTTYWNQESADTSIDYVDPYDSYNNTKGLVTVGVKINNSDDNKVKLEKIITQKWLAQFPMGLEAWNDLRRTGYPRIFPVNDIGDGSLGNGRMIRRIPWNMNDAAAATDVNKTGVPALEGPNLMVTPLWWDKTDPAGLGDNRRWETEAAGQ
ncbi:SusD/RagB family nutrient-binding outer membrane lipoprotein [Barnesiella intestinihominis]|uniref:SusD/RagB family nutrient-binding outer membrane lipoprotein n=1 Tax=Barnesiella intestinihominis TaxID=487174 RepID=UPI00396702F8